MTAYREALLDGLFVCVICACPIAPHVLASTADGQPRHAACDETATRFCSLCEANARRAEAAEGERDNAKQALSLQYSLREGAEAEAKRLREALEQARRDIVSVNTAGFDSTRGGVTLVAIGRIDAALVGKTP